MNKTIIGGVFKNQEEAVRTIHALHDSGYTKDDISIFAKDKDDVKGIEKVTHGEVTKKDSGRGSNAGKGFGIGAGTGGVLGGIVGIIAEIGLLAIPGIGVLAAAGPLASVLTGAAIGAGGGGIVGALTGAGIPKEHAQEYETHLKKGHIVILVEADEKSKNDVYGHFSSNNSMNTHMYSDGALAGTTASTNASSTQTDTTHSESSHKDSSSLDNSHESGKLTDTRSDSSNRDNTFLDDSHEGSSQTDTYSDNSRRDGTYSDDSQVGNTRTSRTTGRRHPNL
ncbi:general stress protein [Sutcliffiella deserti]|uniref:general stress protein n=1 Tax=Sutcliffiella deserti TaxID=2875501 RepID=UPI001CBC7B15|nr:general stress protein [Sutcliffiella deserti]